MQNQPKNLLILIKYIVKIYFVLLFSINASFGQNNSTYIDSLSSLSFNELRKNINRNDIVKSLVYVKAFLERAKREKDTLRQLKAYKGLLKFYDKKNSVFYADKVLELTKREIFLEHRSLAYYIKGVYLYNKSKYIDALDCFLNAKKITKKDISDIELSIGLIKSILGSYEEASSSFKSVLKYYKKVNYNSGLLVTYFALGDAYRFLGKIDSSLYYNQLGKKLAVKLGNKKHESYFKLNIGATFSDNNQLELSQSNLKSALPIILDSGDKPNIEMCHFFLGRNYKDLKNYKKALYHLKKMDSIFLDIRDIHPELRQGYTLLIDYYKSKKDLENQLVYVERLLSVDSVLTKNNKILNKKLAKENRYNNNKLLSEKEYIISQINSSKNKYFTLFVIGVLIVFVLIFMLFSKYYKHKQDKIKFEELIKHFNSASLKRDKEVKNTSTLNINKNIVDDIIYKLEQFEANKEFVNPNISRIELAKMFGTNPKYLSNVIRHTKKMSFIDYIKKVRIDYAVNRMKNDEVFLNKFSIKGMAEEVGFKSSESFSKTFYSITGIKPSYFIKELKKKS